jgi:hypothetical protein
LDLKNKGIRLEKYGIITTPKEFREIVLSSGLINAKFTETEFYINIFRVKARKIQGGHDVPEDKIRSRYKGSMEQLFEASLIADQTYFFDNSSQESEPKLVTEAKKSGVLPSLEIIQGPNWFQEYFVIKRLEYIARLE